MWASFKSLKNGNIRNAIYSIYTDDKTSTCGADDPDFIKRCEQLVIWSNAADHWEHYKQQVLAQIQTVESKLQACGDQTTTLPDVFERFKQILQQKKVQMYEQDTNDSKNNKVGSCTAHPNRRCSQPWDKMNVIASTKDTSALNDTDAEKYIPLKHLFENHHSGKGRCQPKRRLNREEGVQLRTSMRTHRTRPLWTLPPTPLTAAQTSLRRASLALSSSISILKSGLKSEPPRPTTLNNGTLRRHQLPCRLQASVRWWSCIGRLLRPCLLIWKTPKNLYTYVSSPIKIINTPFINCNATNLIYWLLCPCNKSYAHQTKRCLKVRCSENKTAICTEILIIVCIAKCYIEENCESPASLWFEGLEHLGTRGRRSTQGTLPKEKCFGLKNWTPCNQRD